MLSDALGHESFHIESHPLDAVYNNHRAITESKTCGNLVRETGVAWGVHKVEHITLFSTILHQKGQRRTLQTDLSVDFIFAIISPLVLPI